MRTEKEIKDMIDLLDNELNYVNSIKDFDQIQKKRLKIIYIEKIQSLRWVLEK